MMRDGTNAATAETNQPAAKSVTRVPSFGTSPAVLADIYDEQCNLAVWQTAPSESLQQAALEFIQASEEFVTSQTVLRLDAMATVSRTLGTDTDSALSRRIAELIEMFCSLLGQDRVGMRLTILDSAMCKRFHVDRVPCRLITTLHGVGTEWLSEVAVDRSKLGPGSAGLDDAESGLLRDETDIEQLRCGDVALLKGELWEGNEGAGIVHRSPAVAKGNVRLLLTLDMVS